MAALISEITLDIKFNSTLLELAKKARTRRQMVRWIERAQRFKVR